MPAICIYRHPDCARCARIARVHHTFDLFGHVEDTTRPPATGLLRKGEIVVEDRATGEIRRGVDAFRLITHAVPLYAPARWLLRLPAVRAAVERDTSGCADDACDT